jgi:LmbE family N-acetylglucosaminyl deacetylase
MATLRVREERGLRTASSLAQALGADAGERMLYVCPHDDDAIVGVAMMISLAAEEGFDVHVAIVTNGCMGYCRLEDRPRIAEIRRREAVTSYKLLGVPEKHLHFFGYDDGSLFQYLGRRHAGDGDPEMAGYTGLENHLTGLLRTVQPRRVVTPAGTDLHPDHQAVYKELLISIFHASGDIWPELGMPIDLPEVYEYPTYVKMAEPPDTMIEADEARFQQKLDAIRCFASQLQIESLVEQLRRAGPVEFFRNLRFDLYNPEASKALFREEGA